MIARARLVVFSGSQRWVCHSSLKMMNGGVRWRILNPYGHIRHRRRFTVSLDSRSFWRLVCASARFRLTDSGCVTFMTVHGEESRWLKMAILC
ncbi:hypothetical protein HanRHA438_Chr06g0275021 [Helianthus annuus]|nr:hypothetical protein HanRHA438_Chr06g0275021 [Helianthus annuus]